MTFNIGETCGELSVFQELLVRIWGSKGEVEWPRVEVRQAGRSYRGDLGEAGGLCATGSLSMT